MDIVLQTFMGHIDELMAQRRGYDLVRIATRVGGNWAGPAERQPRSRATSEPAGNPGPKVRANYERQLFGERGEKREKERFFFIKIGFFHPWVHKIRGKKSKKSVRRRPIDEPSDTVDINMARQQWGWWWGVDNGQDLSDRQTDWSNQLAKQEEKEEDRDDSKECLNLEQIKELFNQ